MRSYLECIPCFFAQAVRAARVAGLDETVTRELLDELGRRLPEIDSALPPPVNAPILYRRLAELCGLDDPFAEAKRRHTALALSLVPTTRRYVEGSSDRLDAAVRVAAAGNILDLGALAEVGNVEEVLRRAFAATHRRWDLAVLRERLAGARTVLVVGDNAGETVFDRVLLEVLRQELPDAELFFSVRSAPVINDATAADAVAAGVDQVATVVSTGSDLPGVVLGRVSERFRELLLGADLVVAKGQGNFETMNELERELFFLLTVKCEVVAAHLALPRGASALLHYPAG